MNCSNCDKSIPTESKFCMFCGTEVQSKAVEDKKTKNKPDIERYGYGVLADSDEMPHYFTHADRFLIIDLKRRKEVIHEEYRINPHAELCKTKYAIPSSLGERPSEEEAQIYKDIAEILTDCGCVIGPNLGYAPKMAMERAGVYYILQSAPETPREHIERLIEIRAWAGYRD